MEPDLPQGVDPVALFRRYEPVLRYTSGELFFPVAVPDYVRDCALWARTRRGAELALLAPHGSLDVDRLVGLAREHATSSLELRYVAEPLDRTALRAWRRDPGRPRFRGTARFAAVGLLGRLIDSLFRLSLVLRGSVPGGLTAAAHERYVASGAPGRPTYYARVVTDAGYVVLQYWYLYG